MASCSAEHSWIFGLQDSNWAHSAIPLLAGHWVPFQAFKGICCLTPSPAGVCGQARKPQCSGSLSFPWVLLPCWHFHCYVVAAWQLCLCLPDPKPDMQTDTRPSLQTWLIFTDSRGPTRLTLLSIPDLILTLNFWSIFLTANGWEPSLASQPFGKELPCLSQGACPHCSLKHRLSVDQNSSSGELLRAVTQTLWWHLKKGHEHDS